ncbi:restriction endonuclease subunit S [Vibrio metschnikovii]|uniref:restriction endonuclease subunit S n=1 Tax=Vibrio metschnikovii TaxID=28172 RepID=UPI001C310246|nr:restriction endonuclease subunit S [Vibrio metschnikovii]
MSHHAYLDKLLNGVQVKYTPLSELAENLDSMRKPITSGLRESGTIPYYGASGIVDYVKDYIFDGDFLLVSEDGANLIARNTPIAFSASGKVWVNNHAHVLKFNTHVERRFVEIFLNSIDLSPYISGAAQPKLNKKNLNSIQVPIPCPENPEKSLAIQAEIVRVLDAFNTSVAELTNELNMRKKQYSHYQFELLKFTETTQQLSIGECCEVKKGATPIKKATPGKYPLVATTEERQSSSEYQFDCSAVCVPLISSRGHGVASIDRIYYQDGKFALGNILCAIIPNDSEVLSAKFLRYYLFDKKDVLLVPLMRGGANVSLTMDSLKKVKIPIPPKADQQRIVSTLDKFDEFLKVLPREIELRRKQYEYYRDLLLSFPKSHSDEAA